MTEASCVIPTRRISARKTLLHHLRNFPAGMQEDCIAIVMNSVLKGVKFIHVFHDGGEPEVTSSRIGVFFGNWEQCPHSIRLAYHEDHMRMAGHENHLQLPRFGVWGAGILALELAYGSLPENLTPAQMVTMGDNLVKILRQKLDNDKKRIRRLPSNLQLLLDNEYVDHLEKKLKSKEIERIAMEFGKSLKKKKPKVDQGIYVQKKSFSRIFLEVVMKCLDRQNPTPIGQILDIVFLKNVFTNDLLYLEKVMKKAASATRNPPISGPDSPSRAPQIPRGPTSSRLPPISEGPSSSRAPSTSRGPSSSRGPSV